MITKQVQNTIITKQVEAGFLECNKLHMQPSVPNSCRYGQWLVRSTSHWRKCKLELPSCCQVGSGNPAWYVK